ncbi:MAG: hypothetical protein HYZ13_00055 [Acidobacteria bacterium]|nr:hypothetical protein [Acidobacteriota bacterium]
MRLRSLPVLLLAALPSFAGDYDALVAAIRKAWPEKIHIAIVCDQANSKASVAALAGAAGGMKIMLVDVKGPQDMGKALGTLSGQKPDVVVLIAGDRVAGDGSPAATFLIQRMAGAKVPVTATTEAGVKQGAVVGVGPGTGGKMLVNPKAAAAVGVAVPEGGTPI